MNGIFEIVFALDHGIFHMERIVMELKSSRKRLAFFCNQMTLRPVYYDPRSYIYVILVKMVNRLATNFRIALIFTGEFGSSFNYV